MAGGRPPPREVPAHLNCTAKRFVDIVLSSVVRQLALAGSAAEPQPSLTLHLDAGRSQPEGGGRAIPAPITVIDAKQAAPPGCKPSQLAACARGIGDLASLEGLGEYLTQALELGMAKPTPEHIAKLGWGPLARALLTSGSRRLAIREGNTTDGNVQVGGGSGAGFQVICDSKGIASVGGGGGGGAFGQFADPEAWSELGAQANTSIGAGGGGGLSLLFPTSVNDTPWGAVHWMSWGSGGGSGCGTCDKNETWCKPLKSKQLRILCGAKLDDNGAVDEAQSRHAADLWRRGVLRRCYEAGRLAIVGGGGGGAGGSKCCKALPSLNFGFSFRAELRPRQPPPPATATLGAGGGRSSSSSAPAWAVPPLAAVGCCPDLRNWNLTLGSGESSSGGGGIAVQVRRLQSAAASSDGEAGASSEVADPFAMENTGTSAPGGANRRPTLGEMIRQHAKRLAVDASDLLNLTEGPRCSLPAWLTTANMSSPVTVAAGSQTKEPQKAREYIYRYNPLQGHLADGADSCGGWGDWCCLCHSAQRRIACLPEAERSRVDWFLTEDCCESKLARLLTSPAYTPSATPRRNASRVWRPGSGWVDVDPALNLTDSYDWGGEAAPRLACPMLDVFAAGPPEAEGEAAAASEDAAGAAEAAAAGRRALSLSGGGSLSLRVRAPAEVALAALPAGGGDLALGLAGVVALGLSTATLLLRRRRRAVPSGKLAVGLLVSADGTGDAFFARPPAKACRGEATAPLEMHFM